MPLPLVIGHRGVSEAPENTLPAFVESLRQGAQMLELDVRLSRDEVPVVIHDATFRRLTGRSGGVAQRTLKHIKTLDLGARHAPHFQGAGVPTLEEALRELCPRCPVNIELKFNRPNYRPLTTRVAEVVVSLGVQRQVFVSSFWHQALHLFSRKAPGVITGPLFGRDTGPPHPEDIEEVLRGELRLGPTLAGEVPFRGRVAVISHAMVSAEMVAAFHAGQGTVIVYTVDEPADVKRMVELGVDGIITNRPATTCQTLQQPDA